MKESKGDGETSSIFGDMIIKRVSEYEYTWVLFIIQFEKIFIELFPYEEMHTNFIDLNQCSIK